MCSQHFQHLVSVIYDGEQPCCDHQDTKAEMITLEDADGDAPCARCNLSRASLLIRREHLCNDCFVSYVGSKLVKRLDMNKTRGGYHEAPKILLLPMDFDVASICLLHVLDQLLRKRIDSGRHTSYTLHISCIDDSSVRDSLSLQDLLSSLKQNFPDYEYSLTPLEDCLSYGVDLDPLTRNSSGAALGEKTDNASELTRLLSILPSTASRADIVDVLRRRLTAAIAKKHGCDSILYSDSTTKLAERTLAETAKGRGGALPWLISDNTTMDGVSYSYPLRDLLQKELALYVNVSFPSLKQFVMTHERETTTSSKDMTIDGLMAQYFESVEKSFPSIVANVVRTTSKLAPRSDVNYGIACDFCKVPISDLEGGAEQGASTSFSRLQIGEATRFPQLCFGCERASQRS